MRIQPATRTPRGTLKMLRAAVAALLGVAVTAVAAGTEEPVPISLVNADFEADPAMASGTPAGWTWNGLGGRGTSAGGTLGALLFWQGNGATLYQTTDHIIAAADAPYAVTVDCRNSWYGSPKAVIYYVDGDSRVELGSGFLPENGATWSAWQRLTVSATSTEASVGKAIGVELTMANYPGNYWAEFDNVVLVQGTADPNGGGGGDGGGGTPDPGVNPAATPNPPDLSQGWISTRYNQIIAELDSNANRGEAKVLFIGDSITQFWNAEGASVWTANGFGDPEGPRYALNLGEAGDRTDHVLHRIQPAADGGAGNLDYADLQPDTIVLLIGINNTWFHTNEQIIGGIKAVAETLAQAEPQATIILASLLPHQEAARTQDKIIPINAAIQAWAASSDAPRYLTFLDAFPSFIDDDGAQLSAYFKDGIHMTAQGYALYSSLLLPLIDSSLATYERWANEHGLEGGPGDDEDGDRLSNLYEYALGGDPKSSTDLPAGPVFSLIKENDSNWLEYTYPMRSALGNRACYHLQTSANLTSGNWVNTTAEVTTVEPTDANFSAVTTRIPLDQQKQFVRLLIEAECPPAYDFMFPEGRSKALIMSYDDGPVSDQRLITIFNNHGIKGTFNLNSGVFGTEIDWLKTGDTPHSYVAAEDVPAVYAGHEVASHTVSHPNLTGLTDVVARAEILNDIAALEALTTADITSFAYPFGAWNETVLSILREAGISNARTTQNTYHFGLPVDKLTWHPTTHDSLALDYLDDFLALSDEQMTIFFVWGHSWEYDIDAAERPWNTAANFSWATIEDFCSQIGGQPDIWYAGAGEVAEYLDALDQVVASGNGLINQAAIPVWFKVGDSLHQLDPGQYIRLVPPPPTP